MSSEAITDQVNILERKIILPLQGVTKAYKLRSVVGSPQGLPTIQQFNQGVRVDAGTMATGFSNVLHRSWQVREGQKALVALQMPSASGRWRL